MERGPTFCPFARELLAVALIELFFEGVFFFERGHFKGQLEIDGLQETSVAFDAVTDQGDVTL